MIAFPLFPTLELSITRISWAQEKYKEKLINNFSIIKAGGFFLSTKQTKQSEFR